MEHLFEIQRTMANLACLAILVAAVVACIRDFNVATLLQVIGTSVMVIGIAMNYLLTIQYNSATRRLEPHWILYVEYILSGGGIFIFAAGYFIERVFFKHGWAAHATLNA